MSYKELKSQTVLDVKFWIWVLSAVIGTALFFMQMGQVKQQLYELQDVPNRLIRVETKVDILESRIPKPMAYDAPYYRKDKE